MSIKDRDYLKTRFQNGDIPDEVDFSDLIDSSASLSGDNTSVGDWTIDGNVSVFAITANDITLTNATMQSGLFKSTGFFMTLNVNGSAIYIPTYTLV